MDSLKMSKIILHPTVHNKNMAHDIEINQTTPYFQWHLVDWLDDNESNMVYEIPLSCEMHSIKEEIIAWLDQMNFEFTVIYFLDHKAEK